MDEQDQQQEQQEEQESSAETVNMVQDAAYASGGEAARKIRRPNRPLVGSKSSLDFKIKNSGMDGVQGDSMEKPLTTKPTKRKKQPQQVMHEEQNRHEKQEQKNHRPILQSRARGSGGPPPRKYTLDDLDRMNDEQIYRLLAEDPELHAAAMKAAAEKGTPRKRSTSAPTGSQKSRRSPPKRIKEVQIEKEVPYFQWIVLLVLFGLGAFQAYKSHSRSTTKKTRASPSSTPGGKGKGGKQKKSKVKKAPDVTPTEKLDEVLVAKGLLEPDLVASPADSKAVKFKANGSGTADSKKPSSKKKKKSIPPSNATFTKEGDPKQKTPDVAPTDETLSAQANEPSVSPDGVSINIGVSNELASNENDGAWQTVAKSKASASKGSEKTSKSTLEVKQESDKANLEDADPVKTNGEKASTLNSSTEIEEIVDLGVTQSASNSNNPTIPEKKKSSKKNKKKQKPVTPSVDVPLSASTADDEALALQLQQQEESLARAENNGDDVADSAWEEVATRKKKPDPMTM